MLIFANARISIPRLELMSAVLGLRWAKIIREELSIPVSSKIFWTDSKNVIHWVRSDARRFHQLVAIRIGEILKGSCVKYRRWVLSSENVAAEGTK